MDAAWMVVLGLFVLTCLATYGFFLNVEEAKRTQGVGAGAEQVVGASSLSAKLDEELGTLATAGTAEDAAVFQRLENQETELAKQCEERGQTREAQIHRNIAASLARRCEAIRKTG